MKRITWFFLIHLLIATTYAQDETSGAMNGRPNLSETMADKVSLTPAGDIVNKFNGSVTFSVPVLPGIPLMYASTNVPRMMEADNKVIQTSWVGAGWSLELGSIVIDMHGTYYSSNDAMYYLTSDGNRIPILKNAGGILRLSNSPYKIVELSLSGDDITGVTIINEDGSKLKFGDFQVGVGSSKANRAVLRGGNRLVTFPFDVTGGLLNQVCNRWDLSKVEDPYGHVIQEITYFQETENVSVAGASYAYTRASYPEYIINSRTNQKIHFITSERDVNEYEDTESAENKLEFYEKRYLSSIEVLSSTDERLVSINLTSSPVIPNAAVPDRKKRLLNSLTTIDRNNQTGEKINFTYDASMKYIMQSMNQSTGGSTQITTENVGFTDYLNQDTNADATLEGSSGTGDDSYTSGSSQTTVARYNKENGELRIDKWVGYWKKLPAPIYVDRDNKDCTLLVTDEHVALVYASSEEQELPSRLRMWDWNESTQNWVQSMYISSYTLFNNRITYLVPAFSVSGKYFGILGVDVLDGDRYNPMVKMWEWNEQKKSWESMVGFTDDTPGNWDTDFTNFSINDNLVLIDFKYGSHIWEWRNESGGIVWNERKSGSESGYEWREHYLQNEYKGMLDRGSGPSLIYRYYTGTVGWTNPLETTLGDFSNYGRTNISFDNDRIIMFDNFDESGTNKADVKIWKRTNNFFSTTPQVLWNRAGSGWPYCWDNQQTDGRRRRFVTVNDEWAAVMIYNVWKYGWQGDMSYEANVWLYKYNKSTGLYDDCGYFTYPGAVPSSVFDYAALVIMDNKLVLITPGRNKERKFYDGGGREVAKLLPIDGFIDVFNIDKENPSNWVNTRTRIFGGFRDGNLLLGPNYIGVCSRSSGLMMAKLLHGIDNRDLGNTVTAYRVAQIGISDGMGNPPQVQSLTYSNPIFDPSLSTPGYDNCTVTNVVGQVKTFFNNSLTGIIELRLRGTPYKTESYKPDRVTLVQRSTSDFSIYQNPSNWYLYQLHKASETLLIDGITKSILYDYNIDNGQISRIIEDVDAQSELGDTRDVITDITYAFQQPQSQYTAMAAANMLTQVYETQKTAQQYTVIEQQMVAHAETVPNGPLYVEDYNDLTVDHCQIVHYTASSNEWGLPLISTAGRIIFGDDYHSCNVEGSFVVEPGKVYFIDAYAMTENSIYGNATISVDYKSIVSNPSTLLFSKERTEYDANKYPYRSMIWNADKNEWIVTNTIINRDAYGNVLESVDINDVHSFTKYNANGTLPIAQMTNAKDGEFGYIGLEDGWQDWETGGSTIVGTQSHAGISSAYCTNAYGPTKNFYCVNGIDKTKSYIVDAWAMVVSGTGLIVIELRDGSNNCITSYSNTITSSSGNSWQHVSLTVTDQQLVSLPANGYLRVWCGFPYSTSNVGYVDDVRFGPANAFMTTQAYDPITLQVTSKTDANNVTTYYRYDGFGRVTEAKDDDGRIISTTAQSLSKERHAEFEPADPNFATSITYTSKDGFSNFVSNSGWSYSNSTDNAFGIQMAGETTVRMGSGDGNWKTIYKPAGIGNVAARVDFYPDESTSGTPHVLAFEDSNYRFCVQYWPSSNQFIVQTNINGTWTNPYAFALSAPRNQWYTVEIEKDELGRCTAWVYRKGDGRTYADNYSTMGYPTNWSPNTQSWSNANYYYLAHHYVGTFSQSTTYSDGLGRTLQTHARDGANDIVSTVTYDAAGRQFKTYRPYNFAGHGYDSSTPTTASSETHYYDDPLSRVKEVVPSGSISSDEYISYAFGSTTLEDGTPCFYEQTKAKPGTQNKWMLSKKYTDKLGRVVRTENVAEDATGENIKTNSFYTMTGQPYRVVDPNLFETTMSYDFLGRCTTKTTVDAGTSRFVYDKAGKLRFMVDADGLARNNVLYWKYDVLSRVIEKGYISGVSWGDGSAWKTIAENDPNYPTAPITWRKIYGYDAPGNKGALYKVFTNNNDDNLIEVEETFQYDKYGKVTQKDIVVYDYNDETYSTIYEYDHLGRVTKVIYPTRPGQKDLQNVTYSSGSKFFEANAVTAGPSCLVSSPAQVTFKGGASIRLLPGFRASTGSTFRAYIGSASEQPPAVTYTYNHLGQTTGVGIPGDPDYFASYMYNTDGTTDKETINNGGPAGKQAITQYMYGHPRGWMTGISNFINGSMLFYEYIKYTEGGYEGAGYSNGSIASTSFYVPTIPSNAIPPTQFHEVTYKYDNFGRMITAENTLDNTLGNIFDLGVGTPIDYDKNGNFEVVKEGSVTRNYAYQTGTNKATSAGSGSSYSYDVNGNITTVNQPAAPTAPAKNLPTIAYDPFTLMTMSTTKSGGPTYKYQYDGKKERVLKTDQSTGSSMLYLHGMSDFPLITKGSVDRFYVYGPKGLIAMKSEGVYYYAIKDHLGSTRVVMNGTTGTGVEWRDYSAMGAQMRAFQNLNLSYRFTGQEFDEETGLHNFRARMYDNYLGRFYGMDPAGQGHSPYAYCGGNPIVMVDKDGRIFGIDDLLFASIIFSSSLGAAQAKSHGVPWYQGLLKGAITGFVGGELATLGGGSFLNNLAFGVGEGAITGGLNAALYKQDIGQGMLQGAEWGGGFAVATSGIETMRNVIDGEGFRLNDDVIENKLAAGDKSGALSFAQKRYGFHDVKMSYDSKVSDYGVTYPDGTVKIGDAGMKSVDDLKTTMAHEWSHSKFDRILDSKGNFVNWKPNASFESGPLNSLNNLKPPLISDGPSGYPAEVTLSGKLHTSLSYLRRIDIGTNGMQYYNVLSWHSMGIEKWWYYLPRR